MRAGGIPRIIHCMSDGRDGPEDGDPDTSLFGMSPATVNVVVVGGDAVVGKTLELLLGGSDYSVSFVRGALVGDAALPGIDLLVLAPGLTEGQEGAVVHAASAGGRPGASGVPVVQLVADLRQATSAGERRLVPWPCRAEELERQMRSALGHGAQGTYGER